MCEHCGCGQPDHHHGGHEGHEGPGGSTHTVSLEQDVLAHDKEHAESLRRRLGELEARMVNVIGSPGSGKTELLVALLRHLHGQRPAVVVEGDLATSNDAERIATTGAPVHQIQTGTACHLSAHDVEHALEHLPLERRSLVIVENVGNLVCPSMFDLGEALRLVCLSVAEGADKPVKYPVTFRAAGLVVITKSDLLPHVDFDVDQCLRSIRDIQPAATCLVTSARTGHGVAELADAVQALWS